MRTLIIAAEDFGYRCTSHLLEMGAAVDAIFTARPEAFFQKMAVGMDPSHYLPFESLASQYEVPIYLIGNINHENNVQKIRDIQPDLIAVMGWSQMIRKPILDIPPLGVIGFHPTPLPKRRGRAPINWAIIDGISETAQTMFYYTEGADDGDIIAQRKMPIEHDDTCKTLYDRGTDLALEILAENFPLLAQGAAPRVPQDHSLATYTPGRKPEDGLIDWAAKTESTYNLVRAVTKPYPGAFTFWEDKKLIIWQAAAHPADASPSHRPGDVVECSEDSGLVVKTGDGAIRVLQVQFQGRDISAFSFATAEGITENSRFSNSESMESLSSG